MKVCLVRPPAFVDEYTYPYNLECISSALKAAGHDVSWVDAGMMSEAELRTRYEGGFVDRFLNKMMVDRKVVKMAGAVGSLFEPGVQYWDRVVERIKSNNPDVVAMSCYSASMSSTSKIVSTLAKAGYDGKIVLGGVHPSAEPREVMKRLPEVDYLVIGEGETTIVELLDAISGGSDTSKVDGLCYRDGKETVMTPPRCLMDNLADLPELTFDFLKEEPYFAYVILTSRGCPYHCSFCSSRLVFGKGVRFRPPEVVAKEVETLVKKSGTRIIRFGDDTFTLSKKHMRSIGAELKKRGIRNLMLSVGSRIDTINREKLDILLELGVKKITFGVESGSPRIIKETSKGIDLDDVVPTIKMVGEAGLSSTTFFIINHPTETAADMEGTLELIKKLNSNCPRNRCEINTGFPYPSTQWWNYCEERGLLGDIDFYKYSHRYNHQQSPAVNMTEESDNVLMEYKKKIDNEVFYHNFKTQVRNGFRMLFTDPRRIFTKLMR